MRYTPITVWERFNKANQRFEHNHITDGHTDTDNPKGTKEQEQAWCNATWAHSHKYLDENAKVVSYASN